MRKIICIYGLAASGKTTQADLICAEYDMVQFDMGDTLRAEIESGSELSQKIKSYVDQGILITDDLMAEVIKKVGDEAKTKGIVFSGFPRMMSQATMLEKVGAEMGMEIENFIYLKIGMDEVIKRINKRSETGGRADDKNPAAIQNRIDVFAKESVPLLEYYKNNGKLVEIDGEMSIPDVFAEIKKHL